MELSLHDSSLRADADVLGESRAFLLLETARLRCEMLMACYGRSEQLASIHREIGVAGYVTCAEFAADTRQGCVELAGQRLTEDRDGRGPRTLARGPIDIGRTLATMFSETIAASDALASELSDRDLDEDHRDRLHLVHAHVMSACELLDERLTVLELEGAGVEL